MKHRLSSTASLLAIALLVSSLSAGCSSAKDYRYISNPDGTITIVAYTGKATTYSNKPVTVTIPSKIDGHTVSMIGYEVRAGRVYGAFASLNTGPGAPPANVTVVIPDTVWGITDDAFRTAAQMSAIVIPDSVTDIGTTAFMDCIGLTTITFPASVKGLGDNLFAMADNLTSVYFEGDAPNVSSHLFDLAPKNIVVYYHPGKSGFTNPWQGRPTKEF